MVSLKILNERLGDFALPAIQRKLGSGWWSEAHSPVTVWNVQPTGIELGTRPSASMRIVRSFSGFLSPVAVC